MKQSKLQENKKLLAAIDVAIKAAEKTSGKEKVFRATLLEISNLKKDMTETNRLLQTAGPDATLLLKGLRDQIELENTNILNLHHAKASQELTANLKSSERALGKIVCGHAETCSKILEMNSQLSTKYVERQALQLHKSIAEKKLTQQNHRCIAFAFVVRKSKAGLARLERQRKVLLHATMMIQAEDWEKPSKSGNTSSEGPKAGSIESSFDASGNSSATGTGQTITGATAMARIKTYHPHAPDHDKLLKTIDKISTQSLLLKKTRMGKSPSGRTCDSKSMCHGQGTCLWDNLSEKFFCECRTGFEGEFCLQKLCPNKCNGNGDCMNGECLCNVGFCGQSCFAQCDTSMSKKMFDIFKVLQQK